MHKYTQGQLPVIFNDTWKKRVEMHAGSFTTVLRNSDDLYIPVAMLKQSEKHPLYLFPKLWSEFDNENVKILRDTSMFNVALKKHLFDQLPANVVCTRLFCPSCSTI